MNNLPEFLTVKQVAELMGLHPNSVYLRCTSGEVPSFKSGNSRRIRREAYLQWIAKLEQETVSS